MDTHIHAVRRLAADVIERKTTELTFGLFRLYLAAAGATQSGSWVYCPGRATPLKGWRAVGGYVADLPDTSGFLRALANAADVADRELRGPISPPPTIDELGQVAGAVADLAKQIASLSDSRPAEPVRDEVFIGDDVALGTLIAADRDIADRIVKRAVYTAGRTMLENLDGWVATARENAEAGSGSAADAEQFHADDVRTMVNDMCRELGAPVPWRPTS